MVRWLKIAVIVSLALGLVSPAALFAESVGYPEYDYNWGRGSLPRSPTLGDEELSEKVNKALGEWTKTKFPGQGKVVHRAIVVGLDLYLVMSMWWSDMGFTSRLNKTGDLWEFWSDYYMEEGPKYENIVIEKEHLRVFLIDGKGRVIGGSHKGRDVRAWAVQ